MVLIILNHNQRSYLGHGKQWLESLPLGNGYAMRACSKAYVAKRLSDARQAGSKVKRLRV